MALSTKRALAQSFRNLLSRRTLDKITVKDIVEDCGVNRQTFYYHFHDVYDLLEWIFEDMMESMTAEELDYDDWAQGLDRIVALMLGERRLILNAYHSISHEAVSQFIKRWLRPFIAAIVDREAGGMDIAAKDRDFVVDLFTLGATGFVTEWVEEQMAESHLVNMEKFKIALDGSLESVLQRFARKPS